MPSIYSKTKLRHTHDVNIYGRVKSLAQIITFETLLLTLNSQLSKHCFEILALNWTNIIHKKVARDKESPKDKDFKSSVLIEDLGKLHF